jgi:Glycosyl hydrolases family 2, TIM barrel domain/Glycosyl hydrolases family 2, sugar binding domain/Glycosyl hydrolases family 2
MSRKSILAAFACAAVVLLAPAGAGARAPVPAEGALYQDGPSWRYLLERGWTTRADKGDRGLAAGWQRPGFRSGFRPVEIPNAFNARDLTAAGQRSWVQWYRTSFRLPKAPRSASWRIRFESVNRRADVWLNGRKIGSHEGGYLPFELTAADLRRGDNELVVRVDGRESKTDIPPAGRDRGWWNYGGLLREVYLRRAGSLDLGDPQVVAKPGQPVSFSAVVRNTTRGRQPNRALLTVSGPNGFAKVVSATATGSVAPGRLGRIRANFEIPGAALWSPQSPALYELRVRLAGGQETTIHFGVREFTRDSQGRAYLNGRPLSLRGASFHEDLPRVGAALSAAGEDQIASQLTDLGADFARQHYPPHPRLLEAFDRLGIVFWEQLPVWRMRGTAELRSRRVRAVAENRLTQAILRDRNHASVMAWSVGNEILRGGAPEERYIRDSRRISDRLDGTRFLAIDKTLSPIDQVPDYYRLLDALGVSDYLGWYGGTSVDELPAALDAVRDKLPGVALFATEFGAEANRDGPASEHGTFGFQSDFLDRTLSVFDRTPYLNGAIAWLLRDYPVRPGWGGGNPHPSPPYSKKGLLDLDGSKKPAWEIVHRHFTAVAPTAR